MGTVSGAETIQPLLDGQIGKFKQRIKTYVTGQPTYFSLCIYFFAFLKTQTADLALKLRSSPMQEDSSFSSPTAQNILFENNHPAVIK